MPIKSSKEALATYLGCDMADLTDYNYHPGYWSRAVYALEDYWYCATPLTGKPAEPRRQNYDPIKWEEVPDEYINSQGWKIYRCAYKEE